MIYEVHEKGNSQDVMINREHKKKQQKKELENVCPPKKTIDYENTHAKKGTINGKESYPPKKK